LKPSEVKEIRKDDLEAKNGTRRENSAAEIISSNSPGEIGEMIFEAC